LTSAIAQTLTNFLFTIPCVLLALTVHEVCHGFVAYKLGDPTARNLGRLTLNPLKHLDPIGTLCMIIFHFGWAKPVPINTRHFKKPKRDMALTALAGPVSNILMGLLGIFLYCVCFRLFSVGSTSTFGTNVKWAILMLLRTFYSLNLSLAVFNFLPIPPLDGSRILLIILPAKQYFAVMKYERYIQLALLLALWVGLLDGVLSFLVSGLAQGMFALVQLLPFI